jgi:hypothetical protein
MAGFDRNQHLGGEGSLKRYVLRVKSSGFESPQLFHGMLKWLPSGYLRVYQCVAPPAKGFAAW